MQSTDTLAHGNKPHSAAALTGRLDDIVVKFRQQLSELVEQVGDDGLCRSTLETVTADLRSAAAYAARSAFVSLVESTDPLFTHVVVDGTRCRFKGVSEKQWFTPFGVTTIHRRVYAADEHMHRVVPLDNAWGMTGRYLTPEVEEMVTFASALMTPTEVQQMLAKALPASPSATAIKTAIRHVGGHLETHADAVAKHVDERTPLSTKGDSLVVSWDGVMVPLRGNSESAEWKEAGIARLSIYDREVTSEQRPKMVDSRYLARMPEPRMVTLLDRIASQVAALRASRSFEHFAIICDGKESIWTAAARTEFDGAVRILDFYHAATHLSAAANAIHGEGTSKATRWFERKRHDLRHFKGAIGSILRSLRRYRKARELNPAAAEVVRKVINHFTKNQRRMRYREFVDMGLPIGSGHVESAAKNIVGHRLKRSGMRWSSEGGQNVLNLRTLVKDGRWGSAWQHYRDRIAA